VSNYFGATVGSRVEKDTYSKLAIELELKPEEILYLTRTSTGIHSFIHSFIELKLKPEEILHLTRTSTGIHSFIHSIIELELKPEEILLLTRTSIGIHSFINLFIRSFIELDLKPKEILYLACTSTDTTTSLSFIIDLRHCLIHFLLGYLVIFIHMQ